MIHIFLPVYNRGPITASFISHALRHLPAGLCYQFWILDDGCTDNTVELALKQMPAAKIIELSGNAYWGGALNVIRKIIVNRYAAGFRQEHYLVCNDDIRFQNDSLNVAINSLRSSNVVCALPEMVDHELFLSEEIAPGEASSISPMHRFDTVRCQFVVELDPCKVDTASTYAMLTTCDPWIASEPIPSSIPHYLSDWWLTHSFSNLGFAIIHPPGFACFTSTLTTNNKVNNSVVRHDLFSPILKFRDWFKYARESVDPKSPSYAPAWITFLARYSNLPRLWTKLLRYRLAFLVGSFLKQVEAIIHWRKSVNSSLVL